MKTREERLQELKEFIKKNGRLPMFTVRSEYSLYQWMQRNRSMKEVEEIWISFKHKRANGSNEEWIKELKEFIKKNGRLPIHNIASENKLYQWTQKHRSIKEVKEIWDGFEHRCKSNEEWIKEIKKFIRKNGRLPICTRPSECSLYQWMQRNRSIEEVKEIWDSFKKRQRSEEVWISELIEFTEKDGRLPKSSVSSEEPLYQWIQRHRYIKIVKEIWEKFDHLKTPEKRLPEFIEWVMKNEKFPSYHSESSTEKSLSQWMFKNNSWTKLKQFRILFKNRENPKAKELLEVYIKEI